MTAEAVEAAASPLLIAVAPNGARKTKQDHPALPITPTELAETARAALDAGAAMIHLHVRDDEERHSLDVERYRDATTAVRQAVGPDMIIQVTSEAAGVFGSAEQMAMVRALTPQAVSLAVREIMPDAEAEAEGAAFLAWMAQEQIRPQYILYSAEDVTRLFELRRRGIVPDERPFLLFVLGRYTAGQRSQPADLLPFLTAAEGQHCDWAICAFGPLEGASALTAAALGGHVRVGFENNLFLADGTVAPDNAALVRQVAESAALMGRRAMSPAEARRHFAVERR